MTIAPSCSFDSIGQMRMVNKLENVYGKDRYIEPGPNGSIYMIPKKNQPVPVCKVTGISNSDKFLKKLNISRDYGDGTIKNYDMVTRGSEEKAKNVTNIIVEFKNNIFGKVWTLFLEEARPIDILRRGIGARILAFPAGIIGDEAKFANESAKEGAIRELAEETGLSTKKIINLSDAPIKTTPGLTDEGTYYFKAIVDDLKPVENAKTDGGVTRAWHFVPVKNIGEWLKNMAKLNKIPSGQCLTAIALNLLSKGKI